MLQPKTRAQPASGTAVTSENPGAWDHSGQTAVCDGTIRRGRRLHDAAILSLGTGERPKSTEHRNFGSRWWVVA